MILPRTAQGAESSGTNVQYLAPHERSGHDISLTCEIEAGVDAPPFGVLWDRYRRCVLYAWIAATTTASMGSRWQPVEIGMLGMTRATDACADLETVEALRDRL